MAKANLQRKLMLRVLLPMIIGMTITLLTAYIPFYLSFPTWIDSITSDMIDDRKTTLKSLCTYLCQTASTAMSYPINFLLLSSELINMYYNKTILIKSDFVPTQNFINANLFQLNETVPFGYLPEYEKSFTTSMWYLKETTSYSEIQDKATLDELFDSAVFDFFIRPMIKVGNQSPEKQYFQRSISGFEYDGLVYNNPTEYQSYFINYTNKPACVYNANLTVDLYDPRCRPWFNDSYHSSDHDLVTITGPYLFADNSTVGQTLCIGRTDDEVFQFASCIDYSMQQLGDYISVINRGKTTYAFAVSPQNQSFVHPNANGKCTTGVEASCLIGITSVEMQSATSSEKDYFNTHILPKFSLDETTISEYNLLGDKIIIAISPVYSNVGLQKSWSKVASIGYRIEERSVTDPFTELKASLTQLLYIEGVGLFIFISVVLVLCWFLTKYVTKQIIRPIDSLVEILDQMMNGDLDINIEEHYNLCSSEITKLYTVFTKLKIVLRFGKTQYFTEDSEAIMNYAQALSLFLEYKNMEGVGVCFNNLGIIHLKNKRYHEAIECFAKALEDAETLKNDQDIIIKRKHMLATTMIEWKKNDRKPPSLMIDLIESYVQRNQFCEAIDCLMITAKHCIRNDMDAKTYIEEAEDLLRNNVDFSIPKEILEAKIQFCRGLELKRKGLYREACDSFIDCLIKYETYDPQTRADCVQELNSIFTEFHISFDYLDYLNFSIREPEKDVIFLVDYSYSMNGIRLQKTQNQVIRMICKYLKPRDRISYILFNNICTTVFNLTAIGNNLEMFSDEISKKDSPKKGTAFYDAIVLALQTFHAYKIPARNVVPFDISPDIAMERAQWIVALVDGDDNKSKVGFSQAKKMLMKSQANLVAIGLELSPASKTSVKDLCDVTKRGMFIDCPHLSDLDKAFQALSIVISSELDETESLD